jgi:hypothetical protein
LIEQTAEFLKGNPVTYMYSIDTISGEIEEGLGKKIF